MLFCLQTLINSKDMCEEWLSCKSRTGRVVGMLGMKSFVMKLMYNAESMCPLSLTAYKEPDTPSLAYDE